ncbi:hypothetical protein ABI59_05025 [Acidobacteria bacterium Mor1]|nr:hypothetical protein ABI59_05025 [Acidobacteria bacterium Mor1]
MPRIGKLPAILAALLASSLIGAGMLLLALNAIAVVAGPFTPDWVNSVLYGWRYPKLHQEDGYAITEFAPTSWTQYQIDCGRIEPNGTTHECTFDVPEIPVDSIHLAIEIEGIEVSEFGSVERPEPILDGQLRIEVIGPNKEMLAEQGGIVDAFRISGSMGSNRTWISPRGRVSWAAGETYRTTVTLHATRFDGEPLEARLQIEGSFAK